MSYELAAAAAIAGMAVATYITRAGGFWIMGYVPLTRRVAAFLRHLSSAVLVAIVTVAAMKGDVAARGAILAAILIMAVTRNTVLAMAGGMLTAAALRAAAIG